MRNTHTPSGPLTLTVSREQVSPGTYQVWATRQSGAAKAWWGGCARVRGGGNAEAEAAPPISWMHCFRKRVSRQLTVYSIGCPSMPFGKRAPNRLRCTGHWVIRRNNEMWVKKNLYSGFQVGKTSRSTQGTSMQEKSLPEKGNAGSDIK